MDFKKALETLLKEKGKRNFLQSVEMIVNFRGVDFSKAENRINVDVVLPKGRGAKPNKVVVICDENNEVAAKNAGADLVILPDQLPNYADKKILRKLVKDHVFLAQPTLMAQAARYLARFLGPRGKVPRPLVGKIEDAIVRARRSARISTRGKFLPTIHCLIGTEDMGVEDLVENAESVIDAIKSKVSISNIKSVYFKLTMSKAIKA